MNNKDMLAFPVREAERFNPENNETHSIEQHWGMTLRDYFAAKAISKCMEDRDWAFKGMSKDELWTLRIAYWSDCAYQIADAMLAAREAKQ